MTQLRAKAVSVALGAVLLGMSHTAFAQTRLIASFENNLDISALNLDGTQVAAASSFATDGSHSLKMTFRPATWPYVKMQTATSWDWSGAGAVAVDITNPTANAVSFSIRLDDDAHADGINHSWTAVGTIDAGRTATYVVPLTTPPTPMTYGMHTLPPLNSSAILLKPTGVNFNPKHVISFRMMLHLPTTQTILFADNVRLTTAFDRANLNGTIDAYGQNAKSMWPGKLLTPSDLVTRRAAEERTLRARARAADRDAYGGWTGGPQLTATGFFRTTKVNGKWWLVTPTGHLFYSVGINEVTDKANSATFVTGREAMFAALPAAGTPFARQYSTPTAFRGPVAQGTAFNFYAANLQRKYGDNYEPFWKASTVSRMQSWGFTTIGNWSDPDLARQHLMPYTHSIGIEGTFNRISTGADTWGPMYDAFDPKFASAVATRIAMAVASVKGDPWCMGYFVDNELAWAGYGTNANYSLAIGTLAQNATTSPAKREFVRQMQQKYGTINRLNEAWGLQVVGPNLTYKNRVASWDVLSAPCSPPATINAAMRSDMLNFVLSLARKYFSTIKAEIIRQDASHLYLGSRFATYTPEVLQAASESCDVVSFNYYKPRLEASFSDATRNLNKPCMVSEFHSGAMDRGLFCPGLVDAGDQTRRAAMYQDYANSVISNPSFVGFHWFQYVDEPVLGRTWDGENGCIGFVDVTDTPYPELVATATSVNQAVYTQRASAN